MTTTVITPLRLRMIEDMNGRKLGAANSVLFDHLVGAAEQSDWESEAERFGGLEVEGQLNFCHPLHRQVGRPFALKNPAGIDTGLPPTIILVQSIAHETTSLDSLPHDIHRRNCVPRRQRDDLILERKVKQAVTAQQESARLLLNKIRKGRLDLIRVTRIQRQKVHSDRTCRGLHLCRFCLRIDRVGWVAEVSNRRGCGHGFVQQFKALRDRFDKMKVEASDISARLVETAGSRWF